MFEKCITCNKIGESCVPNLWLLPFQELIKWCIKRQKHLGWSNKKLADNSNTPVGTINRLAAGDTDCYYSTIRSIAITLIGGTTDEFSCTELVEKELRQLEQLGQQASRMSSVEKENEDLKQRLDECRELNAFLKDELKAWRIWYQSK